VTAPAEAVAAAKRASTSPAEDAVTVIAVVAVTVTVIAVVVATVTEIAEENAGATAEISSAKATEATRSRLGADARQRNHSQRPLSRCKTDPKGHM
jgi:hypothetical protein